MFTALIANGNVAITQVKQGETADGRRTYTIKAAEPKAETVKVTKNTLATLSDEDVMAEMGKRGLA
jgi:hypothetical protein